MKAFVFALMTVLALPSAYSQEAPTIEELCAGTTAKISARLGQINTEIARTQRRVRSKVASLPPELIAASEKTGSELGDDLNDKTMHAVWTELAPVYLAFAEKAEPTPLEHLQSANQVIDALIKHRLAGHGESGMEERTRKLDKNFAASANPALTFSAEQLIHHHADLKMNEKEKATLLISLETVNTLCGKRD